MEETTPVPGKLNPPVLNQRVLNMFNKGNNQTTLQEVRAAVSYFLLTSTLTLKKNRKIKCTFHQSCKCGRYVAKMIAYIDFGARLQYFL